MAFSTKQLLIFVLNYKTPEEGTSGMGSWPTVIFKNPFPGPVKRAETKSSEGIIPPRGALMVTNQCYEKSRRPRRRGHITWRVFGTPNSGIHPTSGWVLTLCCLRLAAVGKGLLNVFAAPSFWLSPMATVEGSLLLKGSYYLGL